MKRISLLSSCVAGLSFAFAPGVAAQTPINPAMWGSTAYDYEAEINRLAQNLPKIDQNSDRAAIYQAAPKISEAAKRFLQLVALAEHDGLNVRAMLRSDASEKIVGALAMYLSPEDAASEVNHPFFAILLMEIAERRLELKGSTDTQRNDDLATATFAMGALGHDAEMAEIVAKHGYELEAAARRAASGRTGIVKNVAMALVRTGNIDRGLSLARTMVRAASDAEHDIRRDTVIFYAVLLERAGRHREAAELWADLAKDPGISTARYNQFKYQEVERYLAAEAWDDAARIARDVLSRDPHSAVVNEQLVKALLATDRLPMAVELMQAHAGNAVLARDIGSAIAERLIKNEQWEDVDRLVSSFETATGEQARERLGSGWLTIAGGISAAKNGEFDPDAVLDVIKAAAERGDLDGYAKYLALYRFLPERLNDDELEAQLAEWDIDSHVGSPRRMADSAAFASGATEETAKTILAANRAGLPLPIRLETLGNRMDSAWNEVLSEPEQADKYAYSLANILAVSEGRWEEAYDRQQSIRQSTVETLQFDSSAERAQFLECLPIIADYRRLNPDGSLFQSATECEFGPNATRSLGPMLAEISLLFKEGTRRALAAAQMTLDRQIELQTTPDSPRWGAEQQIANARSSRREIAQAMADLMWTENGPDADASTRAEAFELLQWAMLGQKGEAVISGAADRIAASINPKLVDLIREYRALSSGLSQMPELQRIDSRESAEEKAAREAAERARKLDRDQREARTQEIRAAIQTDFPDYFDFIQPRPLSLAQVQQRLGPDEALLILLPSDRIVHAFAVDGQQSRWVASDMTFFETSRRVTRLLWDLGTPLDIPDPVHMRWVKQGGNGYPFARDIAYELFDRLVRPVDGVLRGKKRIFTSNGTALAGLPLGVLVTEQPTGSDGDPEALRATPWLADRHALINLPSVASLRLLERAGQGASSQNSLAAFGDPILEGEADIRGSSVRKRNSSAMRPEGVNDTDQAFVERLRAMERLPATGPELEAIRGLLGAPESSVRLQAEATEPAVRNADLSTVSILAFATHGVMPSEITGLEEPGLVLTPPTQATPQNDGFLAASEIAALKLDADWVLLSACNTAVGDAGAAGTLTDAFFFAGARSVLASHWPVDDEAAKALTTKAIAAKRDNTSLTRAEALQSAMRQVRLDTSHDEIYDDGSASTWAHPSIWAPFSIYGDIETASR